MFMFHHLSSHRWSDLSAWVFPLFLISSQNICLIVIFVCIVFLAHLCAFLLVPFYLCCIKFFDLRIISWPSTGVVWEEHQPSMPVQEDGHYQLCLPHSPSSGLIPVSSCFRMNPSSQKTVFTFSKPSPLLPIIRSMLLSSTCPWAASPLLRRP